jgi:hypothetical protein
MFKLRSIVTALAMAAAALSPAAHAAFSDKTFTVSNTGDGPLTITSAGISGNTAEYALLSGHNCTTVAAGSSCAMTVRFTPTGSGTRAAASLNFNSNGTNGGTHSIALSGAGGASCTAGKQVFSYTGTHQNITVPAGCTTATIKAWGAGGRGGYLLAGGGGGFASKTFSGLTAGSSWSVLVGQGANGSSATYGGGGAGGANSTCNAGAGGGFSGVFAGSPLIIAGGGGGGGHGETSGSAGGGGAGGGETGVNGTNSGSGSAIKLGGGGGSQTSGGALNPQPDGGSQYGSNGGASNGCGGGGGSGYFGGEGGDVQTLSKTSGSGAGGGGGSGYAPSGSLIAGSGCSVANSGDPDYPAGIGNGGCSSMAAGQNGSVVIIWQ